MAEFMKIPEAARRLELSERTVRRHIKRGELSSVFLGGVYRIEEEDLEAFVEGRRVKPPQAQVPFTLTWARATSEVEFYREISGAPGEDDERLARLLGAMDRFVWRPWRAAIGKKNAAARGEAPADAAAGPELAGPDELELMRGRRNALRDEVRRRIPPFAKIAWRREGGAVVHWFVPEDERGRFRPLVEEALGGEPYTEQDESGEARPEREELLHA